MTLFKNISLGLWILLFAVGCAQQDTPEQDPQSEPQMQQEAEQTMSTAATDYSKAVAVIHPTEGNEASGTVTFTATNDGVQVQAEIEGIEEGNHGFHIHQYGDCTAPDGTSAGGHYNPEGTEHAGPDADTRHVGDMGNIEANAEGVATKDYVDSKITLNGPNSIIGHGVIIHAGEDDLESQPTGAAGPRLGCGVIGITNTE